MAFFGGGTNNTVEYFQANENQRICCTDICSLYSWVNQFGEYTVGHPQIYERDDCEETMGKNFNISEVNGLIKFSILPPRDLCFPVLPIKMD